MATQRYSAEQVITALVKSRGLISSAARMLACDQQTVRNYAARYPTVQQAIDDERGRLIDAAEGRLIEAVEKKGEPWAISLVLKTIGKHRGYVERTEQEVDVSVDLADELRDLMKTTVRLEIAAPQRSLDDHGSGDAP